jgi:hypothetical protein
MPLRVAGLVVGATVMALASPGFGDDQGPSACGARAPSVISTRPAAGAAACIGATSASTLAPAGRAAVGHRARRAAKHRPVHVASAANAPGLSGLIGAIDPQTGRLAPPTSEQLRELAAAHAAAPASASGDVTEPQVIVLANGTKMAYLGDRFMFDATVTIDAQGRPHFDCGPRVGRAAVSAARPAPVPSTSAPVDR